MGKKALLTYHNTVMLSINIDSVYIIYHYTIIYQSPVQLTMTQAI